MSLFLNPAFYDAWSICAGRPALEEGEGYRDTGFPPSPSYAQIEDRLKELRSKGAKVETILDAKIDLSPITGEKHALVIVPVILLVEDTHNTLELMGEGSRSEYMIYAAGAYLKYSLLIAFERVRLPDGTYITIDHLREFAADVSTNAAVSLGLRGSTEASAFLKSGPHCSTCLAAHHCPQLIKELA